MHWIRFSSVEPDLPSEVARLAARAEGRMPDLTRTVPSNGGLKRTQLLNALDPGSLGLSFAPPTPRAFSGAIDLVSPSGVAISIQTGRAKTNNDGVLAVIAGASQPGVSWVLLVLPEKYKGSTTASPVVRDVQSLADSAGVHLALEGVVILTFPAVSTPGERRTDRAPVNPARSSSGTRTAFPTLGASPLQSAAARPAIALAEPSPADVELAHAVVASATYRAQVARSGRHALPPDVVCKLVAQLLASGGRTSTAVLAEAAGLGGRSFSPTFAALRRVLNVDGYDVLTLEDDAVAVRLNSRLLREQFGVSGVAS